MIRTIYCFGLMLFLFSCNNNKTRFHFNEKVQEVIEYENSTIKNTKAKEAFNKGLKKIENEKYIKAKQFFLKANRIEKDNVTILNAIANVECVLGNNENAIAEFQHALAIDSNFIETYINYGKLLNEIEKFEEAKDILFKANSKESNNNLINSLINYNLAHSFYGLKDCENAISFAKRATMYISQKDFLIEINEFIKEIQINCQNIN